MDMVAETVIFIMIKRRAYTAIMVVMKLVDIIKYGQVMNLSNISMRYT